MWVIYSPARFPPSQTVQTETPLHQAEATLTPAIKCCYTANGFHTAFAQLIHLASLFSWNNKSVRGGRRGGRLCRHSSFSLHHLDGGITEQLEKDSQPVSSSEITFITEQGREAGNNTAKMVKIVKSMVGWLKCDNLNLNSKRQRGLNKGIKISKVVLHLKTKELD